METEVSGSVTWGTGGYDSYRVLREMILMAEPEPISAVAESTSVRLFLGL